MDYNSHIQEIKLNRMETLINIGKEMFLEKGIDEVKMTDIARVANIGVASLYRYFGTKPKFVILVATSLWNETKENYKGIITKNGYENKNGIEQVEELLKVFLELYNNGSDFVRFIFDFDNFIIKENVNKEDLKEYEESIIDLYPLFEEAINKGRKENVIKDCFDIAQFYNAITHSLMSLCNKLKAPKIISSDNFESGGEEIKLIINMAINYIKK